MQEQIVHLLTPALQEQLDDSMPMKTVLEESTRAKPASLPKAA